MNQADRKEFDVIHTKIDAIKEDIERMNQDINNLNSLSLYDYYVYHPK